MKAGGERENSEMFDQIAGSYDFLNHLLSLNIDRIWRKRAIRSLAAVHPRTILDVATGTADMAIAAMSLNPEKVVGLDVSAGMLEVGRKKIADKNLAGNIHLTEGACESLPFPDHSFDAAMVAFGVRNFNNPALGLSELYRVLRRDGKLVILEFSMPDSQLLRTLYRIYFHRILPVIGRMVSKDLSAYRYLPESVEAFPKGTGFTGMMNTAGFTEAAYTPLTFGICGLYEGIKK